MDMECDFELAEGRYTRDMARERHNDIRFQLYRAIYAGDIGAAQDAADLMAMVDIDRELIWSARGKDRG
jgi:hypothetical protein